MSEQRPDLQFTALEQNHTIAMTGTTGKLIPILAKEMMPNSTINIRINPSIQLEATITDIAQKMYTKVVYYYSSHRLVWPEIGEFLMGGLEGVHALDHPNKSIKELFTSTGEKIEDRSLKYTMMDYLGFPIWNEWEENVTLKNEFFMGEYATNRKVNMIPIMGMNLIYNEHIRNLDLEVDEVDQYNIKLLNDKWTPDRFTRARRFQNRGAEVLIPFNDAGQMLTHQFSGSIHAPASGDVGLLGKNTNELYQGTKAGKVTLADHNLRGAGVSLLSFYIAQGIQAIGLRNAKIKPNYTEYLKATFGVAPEDSRMQRPEYLGTKMHGIDFDVVTNTANDQGQITGQGYSAGNGDSLRHTSQEWGTLFAFLVVGTPSAYELGIQKKWTKLTRFDYYDSMLANLPDVAIFNEELLATNDNAYNKTIFGWGTIWDEFRTEENRVVADARPSVKGGQGFMTLARWWSSLESVEAIKNRPSLNKEFIDCEIDMDRILKVTDKNDFKGFVEVQVEMVQPIPLQSDLLQGKMAGA